MQILKMLLSMAGIIGLAGAAWILVAPLARRVVGKESVPSTGLPHPPVEDTPRKEPLPSRSCALIALLSLYPLLLSGSLVLVPTGKAGVCISQIHGALPVPLQPGIHFVPPLLESVSLYDTKDRVMVAGDPERASAPLRAQSKEGLPVGLELSVRYRLAPLSLPRIHSTLPPDIDREIVAPVVASAFREVVPHYVVREVFSAKRDEVLERAAGIITGKLAGDGVVVAEVMLRDIVLPPEYTKGLETLLLKEQENEQLNYELEIKEKRVREAELEAEASKRREIKAAEAAASVRVIRAKGEADAMEHRLPLKQKEIEQTRLEAEARMAATVKDAEASAQAQVIKGKGEAERDRILADAEANRIRVTSAADLERMKVEADMLKGNPLLIQKIVAERLSDKMQIMMVPMDGRNFFANDVFRSIMPGVVNEATGRPTCEVKSARR